MADEYGLRIKNVAGRVILDNVPASVFMIMDNYPKVIASGVRLDNAIFNCAKGEMIFVRPTILGQSIGPSLNENDKQYMHLYASDGTITYIKVKNCTGFQPSGYGIAVYGNTANAKPLVFSDQMKFAKFKAIKQTTLTSSHDKNFKVIVLPLSINAKGMYKYINLSSLSLCGFHKNGLDYPRVVFKADGSSVSIFGSYLNKNGVTSFNAFLSKQFVIIEA